MGGEEGGGGEGVKGLHYYTWESAQSLGMALILKSVLNIQGYCE